ncbi:MAG: thioredoxin [Betaproteobacteria bacterium]|nr:thioredoxin [Betaproteobacteria bacterium]
MRVSGAMVEVGAAGFVEQVLEASRLMPVVVDFWAPWCGPCRALSPILEKLAKEYAGRIVFAKINTDENQEIAARFAVRSIPNVKAFVGGKVVNEFAGVIPETAVRKFLDRLIPTEGQKLLAQARQAIEAGGFAEAEQKLSGALALEPELHAARIQLADLLSARDAFEEADALLQAVPEHLLDDRAARVGVRIAQWRTARALPSLAALQSVAAAAPDDLRLRLQLGERHAADGHHEDALAQLLVVVQRDRADLRESARQAMLRIFTLAGAQAELVARYRRALASALY